MSNPTELLDLEAERERMRAAFENSDGYKSRLLFKRGGSVFAENIPDDEYVDSGVQGAWKFWQTAWAAARRAQPEGEAPQSEPVAYITSDKRMLVFADRVTGNDHGMTALYAAATLSPLCGAQHAESGASDLDAFGAWKSYPLPDLNSDGHFDKDWLHREFVAFKAGRRAALAAQQAAAPGAQALLNAEEMAALHRFQETCQDFDSGGYDVDKNMMKRLAAIGVIESKGFGRYQFTDFGDFVIERAAQLDGGQEGSESNG